MSSCDTYCFVVFSFPLHGKFSPTVFFSKAFLVLRFYKNLLAHRKSESSVQGTLSPIARFSPFRCQLYILLVVWLLPCSGSGRDFGLPEAGARQIGGPSSPPCCIHLCSQTQAETCVLQPLLALGSGMVSSCWEWRCAGGWLGSIKDASGQGEATHRSTCSLQVVLRGPAVGNCDPRGQPLPWDSSRAALQPSEDRPPNGKAGQLQ